MDKAAFYRTFDKVMWEALRKTCSPPKNKKDVILNAEVKYAIYVGPRDDLKGKKADYRRVGDKFLLQFSPDEEWQAFSESDFQLVTEVV